MEVHNQAGKGRKVGSLLLEVPCYSLEVDIGCQVEDNRVARVGGKVVKVAGRKKLEEEDSRP